MTAGARGGWCAAFADLIGADRDVDRAGGADHEHEFLAARDVFLVAPC